MPVSRHKPALWERLLTIGLHIVATGAILLWLGFILAEVVFY